MDTTSTAGIVKALRAHLLAFDPPGAQGPASAVLADRLYMAQPDTLAYPYGLIRLMGRTVTPGSHGERETADLEIMLHERPRRLLERLEGIADAFDQAMQRYTAADAGHTLGIVFSRVRRRDTLPPFSNPADRDVAQIRLVYPLTIWPGFLFNDAP